MEAEEAKSYIHEVSKTIRNLRKRIRKNVVQVCKLLEMLEEKCRPRECEDLPEDLRNSLRRHFRDIFWSLKLHLVLHAEVQPVAEDQPAGEDQPDAEDQPAAEDKPAAEDQPDAEDKPDAEDQPAAEDQPDAHQMLQKMARWELVGLKDDEIEAAPDEKSIIDPGSKILEIISDITDHHQEGNRKGSKVHAEQVWKQAKDFLKFLDRWNIFKPKVLAEVTHNDRTFVGASIAVSNFLRPLVLYKRIADFKEPNLRKAIISSQPLNTTETQNWSSKAYKKSGGYEKNEENEIAVCKNCQQTFETLEGFITEEDRLKGEGRTFLGACAEYCPADQLLTKDSPEIRDWLKRNLERCLILVRDFPTIREVCLEAEESNGIERCREVYEQIHPKVHIFGRKPECNDQF